MVMRGARGSWLEVWKPADAVVSGEADVGCQLGFASASSEEMAGVGGLVVVDCWEAVVLYTSSFGL